MSSNKPAMSFSAFLSPGIVSKMIEKSMFGGMYIRLGKVLTLSVWLYETGAILGRFWKDKVPVVVKMLEAEGKQEEFTQFWCNQAKKRLEMYGSQPHSFPIFVTQTDLEMFEGNKLQDIMKIGDKKVPLQEAEPWIKLSMVEGIMFGAMFSDLTRTMLENEYEKIDMDSWEEARSYGVTLSEKPPQMTVVDKEKEAIAMARDYLAEYFPELIDDLGLMEI